VAILLATHVELERAKFLIRRIDCDVAWRMQ
jgi:hypothetical protein